MGFFTPDQKTYVSSTVYNLAGDEAKRPNYLKTTVIGSILSKNSNISEDLTTSYLTGPSIHYRQFGNWCQSSGYNAFIGLSSPQLTLPGSIDDTVLAGQLSHPTGTTVNINTASIGVADYSYWADAFIAQNHPDQVNTAYTTTFDPTTLAISIIFTDSTTDTTTATGYDPALRYLYVSYVVFDSGGAPSGTQYLIYAYGSGNTTLDSLFTSAADVTSTFLPFIPVRIDGNFISSTYLPDVYDQAKKAYKRVANHGKLDALISKISDNTSLSDIKYAYVVFGVSLNVKENACRRYVYNFFETIMLGQDLTGSAYADYLTKFNDAYNSVQAYKNWEATVTYNPINHEPTTSPPTIIPYPTLPSFSVQINSAHNAVLDYSIRLDWAGVVEGTGSGLKKPDAKVGEVWFEAMPDTTLTQTIITSTSTGGSQYVDTIITHNFIRLNWQIDANTWKSLDITQLGYNNIVKPDHAVSIWARDALADTAESGFIIPLHEGVYKSMSLVDSTQMATACCFLVFNTYAVVTSPWYSIGAFQVILVIAAVVITVSTGGLGGVGILGSSAALGASLGFSGLTASIVGAVANAFAAIILVQVIQLGAVSLFGPKLGAIIGAIAGILALEVGSALMNGGSLATAFESLMRVDNLIKLTDSLGKGISGYMIGEAQDTIKKTQDLITGYKAQSEDITAKYEEVLGYDHGLVDPLSLVDVSTPKVVVPSETPQGFFDRTLMAGTDITDLSKSMISDFVDIMLNRDLVTST